MTISRKEFFRQGAASLGKALLEVRGAVGPAGLRLLGQPGVAAVTPELETGEHMVATADNQHCLARGCGCFACLEHCAVEAIALAPGVGIRIDPSRCTGCGDCQELCPVTPRAIRLQPRPTEDAAS